MDQAGREHSVACPLSKKRIPGEFYVHGYGVEIRGDSGKGKDIGFGKGLPEADLFADLNVFELLLTILPAVGPGQDPVSGSGKTEPGWVIFLH